MQRSRGEALCEIETTRVNELELPLRLDEIFDAIGASLLLINADHTIAWANRVAEKRYGSLAVTVIGLQDKHRARRNPGCA